MLFQIHPVISTPYICLAFITLHASKSQVIQHVLAKLMCSGDSWQRHAFEEMPPFKYTFVFLLFTDD